MILILVVAFQVPPKVQVVVVVSVASPAVETTNDAKVIILRTPAQAQAFSKPAPCTITFFCRTTLSTPPAPQPLTQPDSWTVGGLQKRCTLEPS